MLVYEALERRGYVDTRICIFMETFMPLVLCVNIVVTGRYYDIINLTVLIRSAPKEVSNFIYYKVDVVFQAVIKGIAYSIDKAEKFKGTFFSLEELEAPLVERKNLTYDEIVGILQTPPDAFEINPAHCSKGPDNNLNIPEDRNFEKLLTIFDSIDWLDEKNFQILMRKLADDDKFQKFVMKQFPSAEVQYLTRAVRNNSNSFPDYDKLPGFMDDYYSNLKSAYEKDLLAYLKLQFEESKKEIDIENMYKRRQSAEEQAIHKARFLMLDLERNFSGITITIEREILLSSLEKVFPGTAQKIADEKPKEIRVCDFYMEKLAEMEGISKQQYAKKYARELMTTLVADLNQKNRSTLENKLKKESEIQGSKKALAETITTYAKLVPVFETLEQKDPALFIDSMVKLVVEAGGYCENGLSRTGDHLQSSFINCGLMGGKALDPAAVFEMEIKQKLVDIRVELIQGLYNFFYGPYPKAMRTDVHFVGRTIGLWERALSRKQIMKEVDSTSFNLFAGRLLAFFV